MPAVPPAPDASRTPDTPSTSGTPSTPSTPSTPGAPSTPDTPSTPGTSPTTPGISPTPGATAATTASAPGTTPAPGTAPVPEAGPAARRTAVVTGASSGIGAATARALAAAGQHVVLTARRKDRIEALAGEIRAAGGTASAYPLDVTDRAAVDAFARWLDRCDVLVNNAGGAFGLEPVATADPADWHRMYETNVLGTLHVTQALLPALTASGDGTVVVLSSTAGLGTYEGGAGYAAAKHGQHVLAETLRLEIVGTPVRVVEVAPGMVRTDEFSLNRFKGDPERARKVYEGVSHPLTADDVADTIAWAVTRPSHVNIDLLVVRPRAQASNTKVHRER